MKSLHFKVSNIYQKESITINKKFYLSKRKFYDKKVLYTENESFNKGSNKAPNVVL